VSTLRPAGKVLIDNKLYDAISRGTLIEKGTRVQVLRIDGGQLVVEEKI
jgi:membrane-bound serine protease (ClpP class)